MAVRSVLRWLTIGILALTMGPEESRAVCGDFGRPDGTEIVELETNLGSICLELLREDAPDTVQNFVNYVEDGDYDGTVIHRSVPDFVIQGGGFSPAGGALVPIPRDPPVMNEPCEATEFFGIGPNGQIILICPERGNEQRTVAMAKIGGNPDSATSQWFISLEDNRSILDQQNGGFTVFARVLGDTFGVAEDIAALPIADDAAGYFLAPGFGTALGSLPLLAETPALAAPFGCWDPGDLSIIVDDPGGMNPMFTFLPDPENGLEFFLSNACGVQIPRGTFSADAGPATCPNLDILGVAVTSPVTLGARFDPANDNDFLQFEFSCEQAQEALAQRVLWQADLRERMQPQLVVLDRATLRVVPEPGDTLAGIFAFAVLGIVNHARRTRRRERGAVPKEAEREEPRWRRNE